MPDHNSDLRSAPASPDLRVLFLEDSADDFELECRELRSAGFRVEPRLAQSSPDFIRSLADFNPDLIISDYTLPGVDPREMLREARRLRPETPFIYVSGTIGEERAAECLRLGAADYVVKGRLSTFPVRVRKLLDEAKDAARSRALEEQMRETQKMDSIGRLLEGVTHDFNNMLAVIKGYAEIALEGLSTSHQHWRFFDEIESAAFRATNLSQQLLAFSRRQQLAPEVVDLPALVNGIRPLLKRMVGAAIRVDVSAMRGLWPILADPGQIEQVLVNFAENARQQMPDGGVLSFGLTNASYDEETGRVVAAVEPGDYVLLSVKDTGAALPPETLARIFEPYHTGKERGRGLGLPVVYGIVRQTGGHLRVFSTPGGGTTFKVLFPRTCRSMSENSEFRRPVATGGRETVLVVEDDPAVMRMVSHVLREKGYTVLAAGSAEEALRVAQATTDAIHLLLTDAGLPGLPGRELARQLAATRPDLRVLVTSAQVAGSAEPLPAHEAEVLRKPFSHSTLLRRVREVLVSEA